MSNELQQQRCNLSNEELIQKCSEWVSKLCKSGGDAWHLQVPVNFNTDPDMLFTELIKRFSSDTQPKGDTVFGEWLNSQIEYCKNLFIKSEEGSAEKKWYLGQWSLFETVKQQFINTPSKVEQPQTEQGVSQGAEEKFKVGNKLKITRSIYGHQFADDEIVTVIGDEAEEGNVWKCVNKKGDEWYVSDDECEQF